MTLIQQFPRNDSHLSEFGNTTLKMDEKTDVVFLCMYLYLFGLTLSALKIFQHMLSLSFPRFCFVVNFLGSSHCFKLYFVFSHTLHTKHPKVTDLVYTFKC